MPAQTWQLVRLRDENRDAAGNPLKIDELKAKGWQVKRVVIQRPPRPTPPPPPVTRKNANAGWYAIIAVVLVALLAGGLAAI